MLFVASMISGGADSSVKVWDLESRIQGPSHTFRPFVAAAKGTHPQLHSYGLTSLSIYPFDPVPTRIITTSYDETLKLMQLSDAAITPVQTHNLGSKIYCHSVSPLPSMNQVIAAGTTSPCVRLVELRTRLDVQKLLGHTGPVLSVAWSPKHAHIVASASTDNRVLFHDIRRGGPGSILGSLDLDDPIGVTGFSIDNYGGREPYDPKARAHDGPVNFVRWTEDGRYIVTAGHDDRIRLWNADNGRNELVHFGPRIRVSRCDEAPLLLPPAGMGPRTEGVFFWPNDEYKGEIFELDYVQGKLGRVLKTPGLARTVASLTSNPHRKKTSGRINALAWRHNGSTGAGMEMYSAHGDGKIRVWGSRTQEDADQDVLDREDMEIKVADHKRKRDILDEIGAGLTEQRVRFT